jgi:C-terminal processing protease CtpA/Prc
MASRGKSRVFGAALAVVMSVAAMTAVAALAVSCEDPIERPQPPGLSMSAKDGKITVPYDATSTSLSISANREWTLSVSVTEGVNWVTPSVSRGGVGATTVRFDFSPNNDIKARSAKITLHAVGEDNPYECVITQNPVNVLTGVNKWIWDELGGWYYWNDVVKALPQPDNGLAYDNFLEEIVTAAYTAGARDTSETPPTMDGYIYNGIHYTYSYITQTPAETRSQRGASESVASTFGFDFIAFYSNFEGSTIYLPLVTWVRKESPADKAGLKRGVMIKQYGGEYISRAKLDVFFQQLNRISGSDVMSVTDLDDKTYEITAVEMTSSPILHSEVLTSSGGKKVAYLFYNGFERGDAVGNSATKFEFEEELRKVFADYKTQGAQELVLDLRYNRGGYVSTCQLLTSLAANVDGNHVFAKMKRNPDINLVWKGVPNPQILKFTDESDGMKLDKIYVLATEDSASASEMVISSIRGVLGEDAIVHLGDTTNGKNVGMDYLEKTIDGYDYEMWPITFKILNAKDYTNYAGGLKPTVYIDELYDVKASSQGATGEILAIADPKERLLKAALDMIDGKTVKPDPLPSTRALSKELRRAPSMADPRRGGARYVPAMAPDAPNAATTE